MDKEINIAFKIDGLDEYITNLDDLKKALGGVDVATEQASEATKKLSESTDNLDIMEGAVKTLAGSFQILAGAASLLGLEDNEFFKTLEDNVMGVIALSQGAIDASEGFSKLAESEKIAKYWNDAMNASAKANPYIVLLAAIAALSLAIVAYAVSAKDANEIASELATNTSKKAQEEFTKEAAKVEVLKEQYKLAGDNLKARKAILGELKKINPEYFENLDAEKTSYDDLKGAVKDYNDEVYKQAVQKAFGDELITQTAELLKLKAAFKEVSEQEPEGIFDSFKASLDIMNPALGQLIGVRGKVGTMQDLSAQILQAQANIDRLNLEMADATKGFTDFGNNAEEASPKVDEFAEALKKAHDFLYLLYELPEDNEPLTIDDIIDPDLQSDLDDWARDRDEQRRKEAEDEAKFTADYDAAIEAQIDADNKNADNKKRLAAEQKRQRDEEITAIQEIALTTLESANELSSALSGLSNARFEERLRDVKKGSEEEEAILKEQFEKQKKFQIAQAVISTAAAIIGQLAVPQDQLTGANFIKAAAAAAIGGIQIATIKKQQYGGQDSSSINPAAAINYNFGQDAGSAQQIGGGQSGQSGQPVFQTYVLASDVTNAQQAQAQIQNLARL